MRVKSNNIIIILLVLLVGAVIGGVVGYALEPHFPILTYGKAMGVEPFKVDLNMIQFTFGLTLRLDLSGVIGMVTALVLYKKL